VSRRQRSSRLRLQRRGRRSPGGGREFFSEFARLRIPRSPPAGWMHPLASMPASRQAAPRCWATRRPDRQPSVPADRSGCARDRARVRRGAARGWGCRRGGRAARWGGGDGGITIRAGGGRGAGRGARRVLEGTISRDEGRACAGYGWIVWQWGGKVQRDVASEWGGWGWRGKRDGGRLGGRVGAPEGAARRGKMNIRRNHFGTGDTVPRENCFFFFSSPDRDTIDDPRRRRYSRRFFFSLPPVFLSRFYFAS